MLSWAPRGHHDEEASPAAIAARPAYIGLVGSARRGRTVLGYLAERGLPAAELERVHTPAGLDLGRTTHQEIAVAILAELVQLRAAGKLSIAGSDESTVTGGTGASGVGGVRLSDGAAGVGAAGGGGAGG